MDKNRQKIYQEKQTKEIQKDRLLLKTSRQTNVLANERKKRNV